MDKALINICVGENGYYGGMHIMGIESDIGVKSNETTNSPGSCRYANCAAVMMSVTCSVIMEFL